MPNQVRFDFARSFTPRVVDIFYVSPPVCGVIYFSEVPSSSTGYTSLV
jgi:hypothetical protein